MPSYAQLCQVQTITFRTKGGWVDVAKHGTAGIFKHQLRSDSRKVTILAKHTTNNSHTLLSRYMHVEHGLEITFRSYTNKTKIEIRYQSHLLK